MKWRYPSWFAESSNGYYKDQGAKKETFKNGRLQDPLTLKGWKKQKIMMKVDAKLRMRKLKFWNRSKDLQKWMREYPSDEEELETYDTWD